LHDLKAVMLWMRAAVERLRTAGLLGSKDLVACNLTGHGLKQPEAVHFSEKEFAPIPPTLDALRGCLQRAKR
jgi:threonine synthase